MAVTRPVILCAVLDCVKPASSACEHCARRLCPTHYGAGSSSRCRRCFYSLMSEQAKADA